MRIILICIKQTMKKLDKNVLLETNVEEERRLLYVAMTRCRRKIVYIGHKDSKFIKKLYFFIFLLYNKTNNSFLISRKMLKFPKNNRKKVLLL